MSKREDMGRAERHANPEWKRIIMICIIAVARRKEIFSTDEVEAWRLIYYPNYTTHEKRALGPMMTSAAKQEVMVKTIHTSDSVEASCNQRPKRVWYSLIYRGPTTIKRPRGKPLDPRQFDLFHLEEFEE